MSCKAWLRIIILVARLTAAADAEFGLRSSRPSRHEQHPPASDSILEAYMPSSFVKAEMPSYSGEKVLRPSNIQFKHIVFRNAGMMEQDFPMADAASFGGPDQDLSEQSQSEIEGLKLIIRQECDSIKHDVGNLKQGLVRELRNHTCRCQFRDDHDNTRGRDKSKVCQTRHFSLMDAANRKKSSAHSFYRIYSISEADPFHQLQK